MTTTQTQCWAERALERDLREGMLTWTEVEARMREHMTECQRCAERHG